MRFYTNHTTLIAKIADQAHEEMSVRYTERMKTEFPGDVIFYDMFNQKFAELIIQECVKVMHTNERIPKEFFYPKSAQIHELAIKQHFGIDNE
jgi:hypothetical protein